jgi:hypothetical protein
MLALVIVQAPRKGPRVRIAAPIDAILPVVLLHSLRCEGTVVRLLLGSLAGPAAEEAANGVADRGANRYAAAKKVSPRSQKWPGRTGTASAAVEAIWPKRPGLLPCWGGALAAAAGGWPATVLVFRCWGGGGMTLGRAGASVGREGALRAGGAAPRRWRGILAVRESK